MPTLAAQAPAAPEGLIANVLAMLGVLLTAPFNLICGSGSTASASAPRGPSDAEAPSPTAATAASSPRAQQQEQQQHAYEYLWGEIYSCSFCRAHLSCPDSVISKSFTGRGGRAYLLERCVNVRTGKPQQRLLMTGLHTVADISCCGCGTTIGWRYEKAHEPSQRYKEGKYILEATKILLAEA
eukprot:TRINITY_DN3237_c0_g1_i1.p2 TRINITY_DN3237_c0_g1~~TRINITY_DN3237_c0_g1_i1.p2  ORF type:complete len:183 (+),score=44.34 TRINITY_DN3237_c0_g1_i1:209-757(+)